MKLGVIGCGKMGQALVGGILEAKLCAPDDVAVYDAWPEAVETAVETFGVRSVASNEAVVSESEVVLLCVKPQGFLEMLSEIGDSTDRLLISIAAGIRIEAIEEACNRQHRVVRVMPNTPALVGKGAAGYALGQDATPEDAATTEALLGAVGYVCEVAESDLDAVTAVSGSGPAYVFLMIEAIVAAGIAEGLTPEIAHNLAVQTVAGAAELVDNTGISPATLRENVTSPNGTTHAALESFRSNDFSSIVAQAVKAAADRSRELGAS